MPVKSIFVIPAYNEEANLELLFANLSATMESAAYPYEVIIVNDGSTDATRQMLELEAKQRPIHLINHDTNLGPGAAFRSGFAKALEIAEDYDVIITKEADNTGDYHLIEKMMEKVRGGSELVLASCYAEGGAVEGTTLDRRLLSGVANFMLRRLFSMPGVHTYSSFFRAYNAGALRRAMGLYGDRFIEEQGFACMVEVLINLHRMGLKIAELPMVLRCDKREGKSKMRRLKTTRGFLKVMMKKRLAPGGSPYSKAG